MKIGSDSFLRFAQAAAFDRDEARAEAFDARVILVAGRLVDGALASEFSFDRRHGDAIRFHSAIAATFANQLVDDHALGGIRILATLPAAAFFGGASLVVEEDRDTGRVAQFALNPIDLVAVMDLDSALEIAGRILGGLVADDDQFSHSLGRDLLGDQRRRNRAIDRLATRHRHGIVVQDLVGDVDLCRDCGANGENPGVVVRAIAEIRKDVLLSGEWRLPDPWHAFATHVRECRRRAIHPDRHDVASDARSGTATLGHVS